MLIDLIYGLLIAALVGILSYGLYRSWLWVNESQKVADELRGELYEKLAEHFDKQVTDPKTAHHADECCQDCVAAKQTDDGLVIEQDDNEGKRDDEYP